MFYAVLITALNEMDERLQAGRSYFWQYKGVRFFVALIEIMRAGWMS